VGTLDDAIREHLELKRRQGASEEELERKEAEALGRRSAAAEPQPAEPRAPEPPVDDPAVSEPAPAAEQPSSPQSEAEPGFLGDEPDLAALDPEAARNGSSAHDSADLFDQDLAADRASPPDEPVVRRTRPEPEPEAEPGEDPPEDFLEDTPDFLQETPEHDRLWFEQKPPKDFDFD
jgi:hypothetical protein